MWCLDEKLLLGCRTALMLDAFKFDPGRLLLITWAVATNTLMPPPAWPSLPVSAASVSAAASGNALL